MATMRGTCFKQWPSVHPGPPLLFTPHPRWASQQVATHEVSERSKRGATCRLSQRGWGVNSNGVSPFDAYGPVCV